LKLALYFAKQLFQIRCNPTYEELKRSGIKVREQKQRSCNPTYEELKWLTNYSIFKITPCYNTTYNIK